MEMRGCCVEGLGCELDRVGDVGSFSRLSGGSVDLLLEDSVGLKYDGRVSELERR